MPRVNPFGLRRPERLQETKTFTDPGQPGVELSLTLREPDALDLARSGDLTQEMVARYVAGVEGEHLPFPFHLDGEAYQLTPSFITQVAMLCVMQPPVEVLRSEPYNFEELVALALTMPSAWPRILVWMQRILGGVGERLPNAPGALTEA